jgi:hypothetical protein
MKTRRDAMPCTPVSLLIAALFVASSTACDSDAPGASADPVLTREELLDPETCRGCHPRHYREWASSMHAYAARDPVFIAMNKRGQRETDGELGDFCVDCHAPMAVREGATKDGLNLDDVPEHLKGVTCYFCHNAVGVGDHFNNDVELANDTVMRGGVKDPPRTNAHGSAYSKLHDRNLRDSNALCGGCHDIVTPAGVQLERTFAEYKTSLFGTSASGFETCLGCHMDARQSPGTDDPHREVTPTFHEHLWPGVDVALTDFPDREAQRAAIECLLSLNTRISAITHDGFGGFTVSVETDAGHSQPSGAAQDRRMWVELIAYDEDDKVIFESGNIADGELEEKPEDDPNRDRSLMLFRDRLFDAHGEPAHMFWEAARSEQHPDGYRSFLLPAMTEAMTAHAIEARYRIVGADRIARVTARLRIRPMGMDVLQDLVDSDDLDPALLAEVPTFTLHGASVEWRPDQPELRSLWPEDFKCPDAYLCKLDPDAERCD